MEKEKKNRFWHSDQAAAINTRARLCVCARLRIHRPASGGLHWRANGDSSELLSINS